MWKGATVAESTIHFRHLTGGTEENHKNISQMAGLRAEI
jgi:hypothetical protein